LISGSREPVKKGAVMMKRIVLTAVVLAIAVPAFAKPLPAKSPTVENACPFIVNNGFAQAFAALKRMFFSP
jgi:hypothetical protein